MADFDALRGKLLGLRARVVTALAERAGQDPPDLGLVTLLGSVQAAIQAVDAVEEELRETPAEAQQNSSRSAEHGSDRTSRVDR